jgi:hypothetical protein
VSHTWNDERWVIDRLAEAVDAVFVGATFGQGVRSAAIPKMRFVAAYSTYSETVNGLKSQGFTGRKDYEARSAQLFAQILSSRG